MHGRILIACLLALALLAAACGSDSQAQVSVRPRATPGAVDVPAATTPPSTLPVAGQVVPSPTVPKPTPRPRLPVGSGCGAVRTSGDSVETVISGDIERGFRVHVPRSYNPRRAVPLLVNYHGYDRSAADQEGYSGLVAVSEREGFVLVSPEGAASPRQWEVVDIYPDSSTADIDFTEAMVAKLRGELCIDGNRIFAAGMSNGAEMASQAGCLLPYVFAAVAPVSGVVYQSCAGRPVPILAFHGTEDYNVPFEAARPAMADWARHNGCAADLVTEQISEHVSRESYSGCGANAVVLYVIAGGGHTWPGAEDDAPRGGEGPTTHEISASDLIWSFFAAHPRQ